jgi:nucleotide-binding universal stress UspA family protein
MQHIIAATDGSPNADAALDQASMLARAYGVPLTVVHVIEAPKPLSEHPERAVAKLVLDALRGAADEILARVLHRCAMAGVEARAVITQGPAAEAILRVAREHGADFVVCGTHGRSLLGRTLLGSTSRNLLHAGGVSVLVVPPTVRPLDVSANRL